MHDEHDQPALPGLRLRHAIPAPAIVLRQSWSPDGRQLAIPFKATAQPSSSLIVWNTPDDTQRPFTGLERAAVAAWSADSRQFAAGGDNETISVVDASTGLVLRSDKEASGWLISLSWSPVDQLVASGSWNGTIQLRDPATGAVIRWFKAHDGGVNELAWSPDGDLLASGSADTTVQLFTAQGERHATLKGHLSAVHAVAWSRDGAILASGSKGGTIRIWDVQGRREAYLIRAHSGPLSSLSFSHDGMLLASKSLDGSVRLWRTDGWQLAGVLEEHGTAEWRSGIAFHPQLPLLATQGNAGTEVRVWDVDSAVLVAKPTDEAVDRERALRMRLKDHPDDAVAARSLITILRQSGRPEEAAGVFDVLIEAEPDNYDVLFAKAGLYREIGDERRYVEIRAVAEQLQAKRSFEANVGKTITIAEMELRDLPFFGNFTWTLQPAVNVLLGRNGFGKSHLLRAVVAMLQNDKEITSQFFSARTGRGPQPTLRVDINRAGQPDSSIRSRIVFERQFGKVPVLAIPDMRYIEKSDDSFGPTKTVTDLRSQSAEPFLRERSFESVILTFLYELCLDYDRKQTFEQPLFRLIESTVQLLTDSGFKFERIERLDNARFRILVLTEGNTAEPLPLQKASQGTLSVLSMVGLIYRFLKSLYPDVPDTEVASRQAIVVIDEIDAHLHPVWQQQILQLFRDTFPNVQFLVTAHTPLVVAGCRRNEVAVLRKAPDGFVVEVRPEHFIGATAESLYRKVFDVEDRDLTYLRLNTLQATRPQLEREIEALQKNEARTVDEETRLDSLEEQVYYLDEARHVDEVRESATSFERLRQRLEMDLQNLQARLNEIESVRTAEANLADVQRMITDFQQKVNAAQQSPKIERA